jgi:hypothetical protein
MSRKPIRYALPIAILLLGLALRLAPWGQNRFLEDEALALAKDGEAAPHGSADTDVNPRAPSGLGIESALRLPSLFASLASIALIYALGRHLCSDATVGLLAALLLALSPFDILFASTAFTDPLMTSFLLAALLAASVGRLGAAGLLAGLAAATKQQGLLFLPLVVGLGLLCNPTTTEYRMATGSSLPRSRMSWILAIWQKPWVRFVLGFAVVAAGVAWWDLAREQQPGFLEQSLISYGGLGPAEPNALGQRLGAWLQLVGGFWVSPWFGGILVGALVAWILVSARRARRVHGPHQVQRRRATTPASQTGTRFGRVDLLLLAFVIGYLLLHWLVGFQVWDRYLLGLVPLVALLAARSFVALGGAIVTPAWRAVYALGLGLVLLATLTGPVLRASDSDLPLGGDHGAYDGIDDLAAYIRTDVPPGAVLYHYWLGHHYRFYLYGAPLRLHWYPDLEDLVHDATIYRREPRYIAFPSWRDAGPAAAALAEAGITLQPLYETVRRDGSTSFRLYWLRGP